MLKKKYLKDFYGGFEKDRNLFFCLIVQLVFSSWCLGGYSVWANSITFALGLIIFALGLFEGGGNRFVELIKFPVFWLGLLLLVEIVIAGLNPSWAYVTTGQTWWMQQLPYNPNWPNGVSAPFDRMNWARVILMYGGAWLSILGLWLGIHNIERLRHLIYAFALNGVLFLSVAVAQKITATKSILWMKRLPVDSFIGSFVYKNQGAAYLYILMGVFFAIGLYEKLKLNEKKTDNGRYLIWILGGLMTYVFICVSHSRGGIILGSFLLFIVICVFFLKRTVDIKKGFILLAVIGLLITTVFIMFKKDLQQSCDRMEFMQDVIDSGQCTERRWILMQASWEMFKDKPLFGWGAGAYWHCFPIYRERYPELKYAYPGKLADYPTAHSDWLQILIEYGVVGFTIFTAIVLYFLAYLLFYGKSSRFVSFIYFGVFLTLILHSVFDFILYSPSILVTSAILLSGLSKYKKLSRTKAVHEEI